MMAPILRRAAAVALGLSLAAAAYAAPKPPPVLAPSAILIDGATGAVLWKHNADQRLPIASTTKIMTALLVAESGRLDEAVTVSADAAKVKESSLNLKPGEHITLRDMAYGIMLRSANDACVAVAEHLDGNVPAFVARMNARAAALGCRNASFVNPNGLHDPAHFCSARDLATIARAAMRNPFFRDVVATRSRRIRRDVNRYDTFLKARDYTFLRTYPGAEGIKTGHTKQAGRCFVGAARRGQLELISVILHSPNIGHETKALLDWGFGNFRGGRAVRRGDAVGVAAVRGGSAETVPVAAMRDASVVLPRTSPPVTLDVSGMTVMAPVTVGQRVGRAAIMSGGARVGAVDVVAARAVGLSRLRIAGRITAGAAILLGVGCFVGAFTTHSRRRRRRLAARGRRIDPRGSRDRERTGSNAR
jgi:D-alanyl-D-alanine carboxypeptidase (penicillin-binding protein 5/6)